MFTNRFKCVSILSLALALSLGVVLPAAARYKPKVTKAQARDAALKAVPEGTIQSEELEKEKGRWIYSFDIQSGKEIREVWIDPETGKVLANEVESPAAERTESESEPKS